MLTFKRKEICGILIEISEVKLNALSNSFLIVKNIGAEENVSSPHFLIFIISLTGEVCACRLV